MIKTPITRARRYYKRYGINSLLGATVRQLRRETTRLPPHYYLYSMGWRMKYGWGTSIMDRDWDHIVVLDACRLDYFQDQSSGTVNARTTLGSNTTEFLRRTFSQDQFYDTVYVSSNPKAVKLEKDYREDVIFHDLRWIRDTDSTTGAVLPETVATAARQASADYPHKRLVIHINKPHTPWLGPTAQNLRDKYGKIGFKKARKLIEDEKIGAETLQQIYSETLEVTLPVVEDLISDLDGRIALTADHGELLYERILPGGRYWVNHPKRLRCSALCRVPWIVYNNGDRPVISSDPPVKRSYAQTELESDIGERLAALGYKTDA